MGALDQKIEDLRNIKRFADKFAGRSKAELEFVREAIVAAIGELITPEPAAPKESSASGESIAKTLGL